jgi:hypothetical protein
MEGITDESLKVAKSTIWYQVPDKFFKVAYDEHYVIRRGDE